MIARLVASHPIAPEVRHFTFEVPDVARLDYQPGQFVSLTYEFEGKKVTRAYSTASAPDGNRFDLCLNRVEGGKFSPHLFDLQPGGTVEMKGPLGTFVWKQPIRDTVLVATGTGIAPFRGMLPAALQQAPYQQYTLVFGARYESGLLYRQEWEQLAAAHPNFRFLPTLSRPDETWTGRRGYVQQHALDTIGERRDVDIYICGMRAMVDDLRQRLKDLGFDRKQIISERYD